MHKPQNLNNLNPYHLYETIEEFDYVANNQEKKGIAKYGKPLDPMDNYDWLQMANEELVDAYKYFMAEKVKRKYCIQMIRSVIENECDYDVQTQINIWIEKLEGK